MHSQAPSERVVRAVSRRTARDPLELPPLFGVIDPDALDASVRSLSAGSISFEFAGHAVTVDSDGDVELETLESDAARVDSAPNVD